MGLTAKEFRLIPLDRWLVAHFEPISGRDLWRPSGLAPTFSLWEEPTASLSRYNRGPAPLFRKRMPMTDVTQILNAIERGDPSAAEQLLPLVYEELRKLAVAKMAQENPGHTLQATALVHEAYIRLVGSEKAQHWNSRGHFISAAAEAMRRILVDEARRKQSLKRGGGMQRRELVDTFLAVPEFSNDMLALDEALTKLAESDPDSAGLAKLRVFAGLSTEEAASIVGLSPRSATRRWAFARAWLIREIQGS